MYTYCVSMLWHDCKEEQEQVAALCIASPMAGSLSSIHSCSCIYISLQLADSWLEHIPAAKILLILTWYCCRHCVCIGLVHKQSAKAKETFLWSPRHSSSYTSFWSFLQGRFLLLAMAWSDCLAANIGTQIIICGIRPISTASVHVPMIAVCCLLTTALGHLRPARCLSSFSAFLGHRLDCWQTITSSG